MNNNITLLSELLENTHIENNVCDIEDRLSEIIVDFSVPLEIRMKAVEIYYSRYNSEIIEVLKRLISIFNFSSSIVVKEYIQNICVYSTIPFIFRLEIAKDLCFCQDTDDCFEPLNLLCRKLGFYSEISTPKKIEAIYTLMRRPAFLESTILYLFEILDDKSIEVEYRYRIITSLKVNFDNRKTWATKEEKEIIEKEYMYYERICLLHFIQNECNSSSTRILCGQILLMKYTENIEEILLSISQNEKEEYNVRADATDVVLRYGKDNYKSIAKDIILELGKVGGNGEIKNIYENAQNAHNIEIEQSVIQSLEKINMIPLSKKENSEDFIDFEYVISNYFQNKSNNIKIALNRITLDNALYSKLNCSLKSVFVMIFSYIIKNEYKESLLVRLEEELSESAGICSTGILERLVNTLSGFDEDLGLHISLEDQIQGNLSGRLNSRIRDLANQECLHKTNKKFCSCLQEICDFSRRLIIGNHTRNNLNKIFTECNSCVVCLQKDKIKQLNSKQVTMDQLDCIHTCKENCNEELVDTILTQMMIPTKHFDRRILFLKFFRTYISDIMEEIRDEFKDYMDIPTFDLYFRKAVISYEGEM